MATTPLWMGSKPTAKPVLDQPANVQMVQARMVQHHYVRAQVRTLNGMEKLLRMETMNALAKYHSNGRAASREHLEYAFDDMTKKLQAFDLTINFDAWGFFSQPNSSDSYQQMYERATKVNSRVQLVSTALNPAGMRVGADNTATFTEKHAAEGWSGVQRSMNPLHAGFTKTQGPNGASVTQATDKIMDLSTGGLSDQVTTFKNPFFNPKTKQVFAALNYGRSPHGPAAMYGFSYFVLDKKFKKNALYFAGDTFSNMAVGMGGSSHDQVPYDLLGALYGKVGTNNLALRSLLESVLFFNQRLGDNQVYSPSSLVEAHLFEPLFFKGGITEIYLSQEFMGDTDFGMRKKPLSEEAWTLLQKNAKLFAKRTGAKLRLIKQAK